MTIIEHLEELRNRLFIALGAWIVASGIAFAFRGRLLDWLKQPLPGPEGVEVISTRLLEPFLVSVQTAAFAGLLLASPIILVQVWGFISPGLYPEERRWAVPFVLFLVIAFAGGTLFARYLVLPLALPILLGFLGTTVTTFLSIGDFISKMLLYMMVFGLLFEMPVLGFLLARIGLLRAHLLIRYRRHSIVVGVILAALITPTGDPVNFLLVAGPLVVLYEATILVVRVSQRRVNHE
ncbi:MAG: twin-arginine translocase subunit TatC [Truepera sp.]|nr:twin-arginine translocase subunit TatC [Truepera sp.]